ncbi:MAG: helix-turn-helix transcriptional regulator [Acidaminococcus sp.]|jgi:DNA-binding HxlR family transcriptional regulator|nr:helix-turn-helix transcriptional regulator [Acidaminococcus sp.]MCI2100931.1 helix-turn-helix transcriptional regulator [Acidaminococcus sp.]MCI2115270.1 helix-turn-helix transcriptional regulator [Acidaminococcus sp.]MCI2117327.1 helix-turn-helix transcriptional regulator [Acidaminococcus sp.]
MKDTNQKVSKENKAMVPINIVPFNYAVSLIGGKWKMQILFWLWKNDILRYSELKRNLGNVTHKMLSSKLKDLESDGLIVRHEYPGVPPKVEYYLSNLGKSLMPVLQAICNWGYQHIPENLDPRNYNE